MTNDALALPPLEEEAAAKERSLRNGPTEAETQLLSLVPGILGGADAEAVRRALEHVRRLQPNADEATSLVAYLAHPIRVARLALLASPRPYADTAVLGLVHNAYEVFDLAERELIAAGFDDRIARAVRTLTIDRSREDDPAYLTEFHSAIERMGLDVALVRVVDKLDNVLGLAVLENGEIRKSYLGLAERFVLPMADRISASLAEYFAGALAYARRRGYVPSVAADHARLAEVAPSAP